MEMSTAKRAGDDDVAPLDDQQPKVAPFQVTIPSAQSSSPKTPDGFHGLSGLRADDAEASEREGCMVDAQQQQQQVAHSPTPDPHHQRFPRAADGGTAGASTAGSRRPSGASSEPYALPMPVKLPAAVMLSVANLEQHIRAAFDAFVRGGGGDRLAATLPSLSALPATSGQGSDVARGDKDHNDLPRPPPPLLPLAVGDPWDSTRLHQSGSIAPADLEGTASASYHLAGSAASFLRDVHLAILNHTAVLREEWGLLQAAADVASSGLSPYAASAAAAVAVHRYNNGGANGSGSRGGGLEASISYFDQEPADELLSVRHLAGAAVVGQPLEHGASSSRFNASVFEAEEEGGAAGHPKVAHGTRVTAGTTSPTDLLFRWRCTDTSIDELQTPSGATATAATTASVFFTAASHDATPRRASEPRKPTNTESSPSSSQQQQKAGRNPRLRILLHQEDAGSATLACSSPSPSGAVVDGPPTNAQRRSFRMQRKFHIQASPRPSLSFVSEVTDEEAVSQLLLKSGALANDNHSSDSTQRKQQQQHHHHHSSHLQQALPSILLSTALGGSTKLMTPMVAERGEDAGEQHATTSTKDGADSAATATTDNNFMQVVSDDDEAPPLQRKDTAPSIASSSTSEFYDRSGSGGGERKTSDRLEQLSSS